MLTAAPPVFVREPGGFAARMRVFWPAKLVGLCVGMAAFFAAYFQLQNHPVFAVTVMPLTALDRLVGFHPWALVLYLSLWIYVSLGVGLIVDRRELFRHGLAAIALSATGLGIFLLWPTAIPDRGMDWKAHPAFLFLKSLDSSGNVCPSLHVAFAVFTAIELERLLRDISAPVAIRATSWLWCLGIVYSTLATGQHVAVDAYAGALLGAMVAWLQGRVHFPVLRARRGK